MPTLAAARFRLALLLINYCATANNILIIKLDHLVRAAQFGLPVLEKGVL